MIFDRNSNSSDGSVLISVLAALHLSSQLSCEVVFFVCLQFRGMTFRPYHRYALSGASHWQNRDEYRRRFQRALSFGGESKP
jgi:hypothetical protein